MPPTRSRRRSVEVNSETDFVARNETFQEMARAPSPQTALGAKGDLDKLAKAKYPGGKDSVADTIKEMIGTIGENMTLRRTAYLDVKKGAVASYIHNQMAPGLGKIGVIVALEFDRRRRGRSRASAAGRHAHRRRQSAGRRRRRARSGARSSASAPC